MSELTIPINWRPEWEDFPLWPGRCDGFKDGEPCDTESLNIMCEVDDNTHEILRYDMFWAECSWCRKPYRLKDPNDCE